jgi:predicted NAD/FAD-binding protein
MLAARLLATRHLVDIYESEAQVGGHALTVDAALPINEASVSASVSVGADVAFMVFNERTYPNFCKMLRGLQIASQPSDMSLSVQCTGSGIEYQGSSLNGLFAQRRNLLRPSFLKMLRDITRFNRMATRFCEAPDDAILLRDFLDQCRLGQCFRDHYLIPMSAAIWSADPNRLGEFPAKFILGFLRNHGLLQLRDRPKWLTIAGRSRCYVSALMKPIADRVYTCQPVQSVKSAGDQFAVESASTTTGQTLIQKYDHVVFATHADQTMRLFLDATQTEREVLSGFPYQSNKAVLHTDTSALPTRHRAWASWNYQLSETKNERVSVTYDLNRLQSLGLQQPLCLTLNPNRFIDPSKVIREFSFQHPVFSQAAIDSQKRFDEINHHRGVSYCGAYWGYGFHEDGVNSALAVTKPFDIELDDLSNVPCELAVSAETQTGVAMPSAET